MPEQNLRGFAERVAVVSDGANQFGRAVALQLALQGCYVIVGFANESDENKRALTELQNIGTLASAVEADVSTVDGVEKLFEAVSMSYGRLDLLVNTAQFKSLANFEKTTLADFEATVNGNLRAAFFCAQAAARLMKNRPNAAIVNLVSEAADNALFVAAQTALVGLTKSLAEELAPKIRVNCVSWNTEKTFANPAEFELLRPSSAVAPDDVARTALYLLSPEAAAITGQTISVKQKRSRI